MGTANSAAEQLRLDDGRLIWCTSPAEAQLLWQEVTSDGFYRRAAGRLRSGDTVLDIGGNVGLASLGFADARPDIHVIAAEPAPDVFACLARNFAAHLRHGTPLRAAVAAEAGSGTMVYYPDAPGNSGLYADREADDDITRTFLRNRGLDDSSIADVLDGLHVGETIEVAITTVSDILREHGSPDIALLKIDVERAELDVLRGIREEDWPRIRSVVAEVHDENGGLADFQDILHRHGFACEVRQDDVLRGTGLYEVDAVRVS